MNLTNEDVHECIKTIRRQVKEIGYLVDEFSSFARLPNPQFNSDDLHALIKDVIGDYKNNYKKIIFDDKLKPNSYFLKIDKSQISRVFQNIFINSIYSIKEANRSDGKITIYSEEDDNHLSIFVKDNGIGLRYEKDELIKPYFTTKKKHAGSGLGLAIVEKILFDHSADFSIDNRTDGEIGAQVIIKFEKST